jgi:hypothetical protein
MWKHLYSDWSQIRATCTNTKPTTWLLDSHQKQTLPDFHHNLVCISWYQSCHRQNFILIFPALHEQHTRPVKRVGRWLLYIRSRLCWFPNFRVLISVHDCSFTHCSPPAIPTFNLFILHFTFIDVWKSFYLFTLKFILSSTVLAADSAVVGSCVSASMTCPAPEILYTFDWPFVSCLLLCLLPQVHVLLGPHLWRYHVISF